MIWHLNVLFPVVREGLQWKSFYFWRGHAWKIKYCNVKPDPQGHAQNVKIIFYVC